MKIFKREGYTFSVWLKKKKLQISVEFRRYWQKFYYQSNPEYPYITLPFLYIQWNYRPEGKPVTGSGGC